MGLKEWIGNIHDPNNVHPRILILLIIIVLATFVLIIIFQNYSRVAMLAGILLISLDKIFGKTWSVNRAAEHSSKSKSQTMRKWWRIIFHYGIVDDYLGLIGTGIIIAVIISEICRAFILGDTTILAIPWNRITKAIPTDCFLFLVTEIFTWFNWNFIGRNTFFGVFSTLAKVFVPLFPVLVTVMIFKRGKYGVQLESIDKKISESYIRNPATEEIKTIVLRSRQDYIKKFELTLSLTAFVVFYSIIFLPLSDYLISKKLIAALLLAVFGFLVPIIVLIVDVFFIKRSLSIKKKLDVKSILHWWKFWKW